MTEFSRQAVKIFYDQNGQPSEVLISYELFQKIEALLQSAADENDQNYFWTEDWQIRIQEGEQDIESGHFQEITSENIESALEWLDG